MSETIRPPRPRPPESSLSRRKLLASLGAVGSVATFSPDAKATWNGSSAEKIVRGGIDDLPSAETRDHTVTVTPEYARRLERLLLAPSSLDSEDAELNYRDIARALPQSTQIEWLTHHSDVEILKQLLRKWNRTDTSTILEISNQVTNSTGEWVQDFGEPIQVDGKTKILLPLKLPKGMHVDVEDRAFYLDPDTIASRNDRRTVIEQTLGSDQVVQARFYFEGGDITFDQIGNHSVAFVGQTNIRMTIKAYKLSGYDLTPRDVIRLISEDLGGLEVIVVGSEQLSFPLDEIIDDKEVHVGGPAFHLDQHFVLLGAGVAGVSSYVGEKHHLTGEATDMLSPEKRSIMEFDYTRAQLISLGYRIIDFPVTDKVVERSEPFPTNGIVFHDEATNASRYLLPVAPKKHILHNTTTPDSRDLLRELERNNIKADTVHDGFFNRGGSTHCVSMVLAKSGIVRPLPIA